MIEKMELISEINRIISEIELELNQLDKESKKKLNNSVYCLYNDLYDKNIFNAFIIKKSFWKNKMSIKLMSSRNLMENKEDLALDIHSSELYKTECELQIFDIEALVKIKRFLLSFMEI